MLHLGERLQNVPRLRKRFRKRERGVGDCYTSEGGFADFGMVSRGRESAALLKEASGKAYVRISG